MIEVIAVLLIIGIVAVVAVSRMVNTTSAYDLASQLEVVKAHLRLAQAQALGSNSSWGITFASSTTYYLFNGSAPTTAVKLLGENDATISLTTKKSGLTITSAPQTITFNGYGSPVDGSGNVLTSNTTVTTNGGSITITKNTGFIP
jgi:type II secretory pathway pseudopilin PulG